MTAVQETGMSEIAQEIFAHISPAYHTALQLLFICVPKAYEQFQRGNVPTALKLLMEARATQLNEAKWGMSKEFVLAMVGTHLPATYCADFNPDDA